MSWPEFAPAVRPFVLVRDHGSFKLYRRSESPGR